MKDRQSSEMLLRAPNASSDFRLPGRALSAACTAKGRGAPGKRVPLRTPEMSVGDLATATPTTNRSKRSTSRHQGNSASHHQGSRFRTPSHRTQKRDASRPGRGDWTRLRRPRPWGAECDGGSAPSAGLGQPPPATPPHPDLSGARGGRDCPRAVSLRAPASVSPSLPGTLRVGAPRKDRTHERAHARPAVAAEN